MLMLFVVLLTFNLFKMIEDKKCTGVNGIECCTGYILNNSTGDCEKCPTGYYGDCLKQCIAPYFGEDCQFECQCEVGYYCHFAHGCSRIKGNVTENKQSTVFSFPSLLDKPETDSITTIFPDIFGRVSKDNESTVEKDDDTFKNNYVFLVIVVLAGIFVLFFSTFVITYIYFKCFRKNSNGSGPKENEWQAQYKSLDFEAMQSEPTGHQVNFEQRGRFISDSSYLSPVFVRSESHTEQRSVHENDTRSVNNEILRDVQRNRQELPNIENEAIGRQGDLTEHVYIEITDDDREFKTTNLTADDGQDNKEKNDKKKSNVFQRESTYINETK